MMQKYYKDEKVPQRFPITDDIFEYGESGAEFGCDCVLTLTNTGQPKLQPAQEIGEGEAMIKAKHFTDIPDWVKLSIICCETYGSHNTSVIPDKEKLWKRMMETFLVWKRLGRRKNKSPL